MKPMGMMELSDHLNEMARQNGCMDANICQPITNEIIRQYATRNDYYEQDAVNSMERFLERGILSFENCKETREIYCAMH